MKEEQNKNQLPEGWKLDKLGNVCVFSQGIQVDVEKQFHEKANDRVRFLRIIDFTQNDEPERYIQNPGDKYYLAKSEIAMVRYGTVGFVCTGKEGVIANNLFKIIPEKILDRKYLINFLRSHYFTGQLKTKGATMQALSFGMINPIPIPIAPFSVQQAIVSKIEELFSDLDKGIETLRLAQQQLKTYRQSVLKWAFEGRLTNENVKAGVLPKGWLEVLISSVTEMNPKIPNRENIDNKKEVQFLPMKLVEEIINKIHLTEIRRYEEVLKGSYTPFINGDVIFAKVTPCMENGKIAIVDKLKNGIGFGSSEFHVIRAGSKVISKFIFYYLVQDRFRHEAANSMTGAVGLRRVPKQFIENHTIPLPTIEEQKNIVLQIESRVSVVDKMEENINQSLQQAEALKQSILKKAFEGKLI